MTKALYTSRSTVRSLWQIYRVYPDRLELDTHFGTMTVPFEEIERVELSESDVKRALKGDLQLKRFRPALKLDWANFTEHIKVDRKGGTWVRRILFTPDHPRAFVTALEEALRRFRERTKKRAPPKRGS